MKEKLFRKVARGLSIAVAAAMILQISPTYLTSVSAAPKKGIVVKGKKTVLSSKKGASVFIGGNKLDLDLRIGGKNITRGVKWTTKNKSLIKVDKNGKVTAKKNGKAIVTATYRRKKYSARVDVRTRAEAIRIVDPTTNFQVSELTLEPNEVKDLRLEYTLSDKVMKAGGVSSTYWSYVDVSNPSVLAVDKANNSAVNFKVVAGAVGEATVSVVANQTSKAKAAGKFGVFANLKVIVKEKEVEAKLAASQSGTSKIRVTGKYLSNVAADYKVTSGFDRTVSAVLLNADATEAILTMSLPLTAGEYTLTYKEENVNFMAEAERIGLVDVPNKVLVLDGDYPFAKGKIEYKIFNQFNEDITKRVTNLNVAVAPGTATFSAAKGLIEVDNIPLTLPLGSKVSVTIVSLDPTLTGSGRFDVEISTKAQAAGIEVKGIYDRLKKTPYQLTSNSASENANARLLVLVKDQYNRSFPSTSGLNISVNPGTTGLGINSSVIYTDVLTIDGVDYIAIPLTGTDVAKEGKATVNFIALAGTGSNNVKNFEVVVAGTKQVSDFELKPPSQVFAKEKTEFGFVAKNSSGQMITDYETLTNTSFGVKLPPQFSFVKSGAGVKLIYDATLDPTVNTIVWSDFMSEQQTNAIFTIASSGLPKFSVFSVKAPAKLVGIKEFKLYGLTASATSDEILEKIILKDDWGREHKDLKLFGDYYIGINKNLSRFTFVDAGGALGTVNADIKLFKISDIGTAASLKIRSDAAIPENVVTENLLLSIHKDNTGNAPIGGSELKLLLTAADIKNLSEYDIKVPAKLFTGTTNDASHVTEVQVGNQGYNSVKVKVYGKAANGEYVTVKDADFNVSDTETIIDNASKTIAPSKMAFKATKDGDLNYEFIVVVDDGKGVLNKKTVTLSAKKPEVKDVEQKTDEITAGDINGATVEKVLDTLNIFDNYTSEENNILPSTKAAKERIAGIRLVKSSNAGITVNWNNTKLFKITGAVASDELTLEVRFEGGVTKTFNYKIK